MKHSNKELYKIEGISGIFTAEAVKGLNNIYHLPANPESKTGYRWVWLNLEKTARKLIFTYGEKTWFDTKEERDAYRIEQNKARKGKQERAKQIKEINEQLVKYDLEQLKKIAEIIKNL